MKNNLQKIFITTIVGNVEVCVIRLNYNLTINDYK